MGFCNNRDYYFMGILNMKINFKSLVIIQIMIILILAGLVIKIKSQEKEYSCKDCTIRFEKWNIYGGENKMIISVPLQKLYQGYIKDRCPVEWDKSNAYVFSENFSMEIE